MTITRIDNSKPGAPTDLTEEAASKPVAPANLTEQAESKPVAPANLTEQAKNDPAAPVTLTGIAANEPLAPLNLSELSKVDPAAPANLTEIAKSEPLAPTNLSELDLSNPVAPVNLTEIARPGINRTLSPLFNFNAALGLPDTVTYSRSSSASYVETYRGPLGRFQKRLTNDYVGSVTNGILYSEQFDNAVWNKVRASITKTNEKILGSNVFKFIEDTTASNTHTITQAYSVVSGNDYNLSVLVKPNGRNNFTLLLGANFAGSSSADFNILNGTVSPNAGLKDASIQYVANGFYRVSVTSTATGTGGGTLIMFLSDSISVTYTGNGVSGLFISKSQLTLSAKPLPYVRTFDSAVTETFTANPRYEEKGLLVEGASTNLLLDSEAFDGGFWSNTGTTATANQTLAPDGSFSADKLDETSAVSLHITAQNTSATIGASYTFSFYAKAAENTFIQIVLSGAIFGIQNQNFNLSTGQLAGSTGDIDNATIDDVGNGWYRCAVTSTAIATGIASNAIVLIQDENSARSETYLGTAGDGIFLWGAQLEALPFATSYIRTEGSVVSRSLESMLFANPASLPKINENQTVHIEFNFNASGVLANRYLFRTSETNNSIEISAANKLNYFLGGSVIAGSGSPNMIQDLSSVTVQYDKTANQIRKYENKVLIASAAYVAGSGSLTAAGFGMSFDSTRAIYGHISKFEIHDIALTANEVKAL